MDRMQEALKTAGSLLNRLKGSQHSEKPNYSKKIITRLAEQLYLLSEADKSFSHNLPKDAYLMIEARINHTQESEVTRLFFEQLLTMYRQWSHRRRMRYELLENSESVESSKRSIILAVNGLGAYPVLQFERGLHVLEIPRESNAYDRVNARVNVIGQPETPTHTNDEHLHHARRGFAAADEAAKAAVVRRYRREPSPLVRDARRNYRTGLIDKVMGGDFDLFG
jgi:ATP-dependent Clp protease ATP-binding subunit ClpC